MTAKVFLNQAYLLEQRINTKLEQIASLDALANKCTTTITGMPHNQSKSVSLMESAIIDILTLKESTKNEVAKLVALKFKIATLIKSIDNIEYQTLLEKRYLCFKSWEEIAKDMNYSLRWIHIIHSRALNLADKKIEKQKVCT